MNNAAANIRRLFSNKKIRYLFSGGISFVVEYGLFALLNLTHVNIFLANSLSFSVALIVSFVLHKTWSFSGDHQDNKKKQLTVYIALALFNLVLTNILIGALVNNFRVPALIAKVISMFMIIIWNYVIMSRFIFRKRVA